MPRLKNIGARNGLYELRCTNCKQHLIRNVDSDWSSIWWWSRKEDNSWEYKEHDDDDGLLDLRGFTCKCANPIYWVYSKRRTLIKYYTMRVETESTEDQQYILQQVNQLMKEKKWKAHVE